MELEPRTTAVILLIDDEVTPLSCRTLVLQSEGYSVLTASSAEEALKIFQWIRSALYRQKVDDLNEEFRVTVARFAHGFH